MPFVVIPQPFPTSPLQTQFDTEDEANARAQAMVEASPKQPVYVAELRTLYQGSVTVSASPAVSQPKGPEQG
ncbi:hypothetical protein ACR96V_31035 [Pseudomonas aeruginosa]|jgi:hypothetical protein|uniref:Uncharacterized protein n=1 Tax=Pseudomonas aeruginosa TaxID=287 RepID=A0A844NUK6_PSEAI|nr:hypothetical protein [Pseudomonas aeruginosa]EQL43680.1 hypothetical protein M770_31045 [Pseudomonas aeruginosa VRFPA03]EIU3316452.1 hypothetical protein [Pseudomonas aeruginosa]EIY2512157.1 hypothetical protein [Pseudomonas aeruginosa]EIY2820329.1 hypothetical protein [Pseudomonas aeruginosa]EJB8391103.1 hypothetical protein [Pseudomonas aeruginosa]